MQQVYYQLLTLKRAVWENCPQVPTTKHPGKQNSTVRSVVQAGKAPSRLARGRRWGGVRATHRCDAAVLLSGALNCLLGSQEGQHGLFRLFWTDLAILPHHHQLHLDQRETPLRVSVERLPILYKIIPEVRHHQGFLRRLSRYKLAPCTLKTRRQ